MLYCLSRYSKYSMRCEDDYRMSVVATRLQEPWSFVGEYLSSPYFLIWSFVGLTLFR